MERDSRLDAYHFYEIDWKSYEQLCCEFEWEVPERFNIAEYVCDRWATEKGRVALFAENTSGREQIYTFWQLKNLTNQLANALTELGIGWGDRVGVNTPQKPETLLAHIALWKVGAITVPLSTLFGPDALFHRLDDCGAVACIVDDSNVETLRKTRDELDSLRTTLTVDAQPQANEVDFWDILEENDRTFDVVETDADEDAVILYTSGTTGPSKGVLFAHRMLLGNLPSFITTFCNMDIGENNLYWTPSEWAWIASLFDILFPGLYYGKPVLAYSGGKFDPENAFRLIEKYGVTTFFAPPTALRMMSQVDNPSNRFELTSVHVVASGGESLDNSIVDWARNIFPRAAIHESYGQTEANMILGDCTALAEFHADKTGPVSPGHEVTIVDPDTAEPAIEPGEIGEIAVKYEGDPVCFVEYWNNPEKSAEKIQNGWLLTGDLGTVDEDGYFTFKSRKDDVIISAGYRIGPEEVEEGLSTHPAVADAGVIGLPDEDRGEVPIAFIVTTDNTTENDKLAEELKQFIKTRVAKYEYPREVTFIDDLPKTSTGKIRRTELREWKDV